MRSVFLQRDKTVFDVNKLPLEEFALSLGLSKAPKIRFVSKQQKKMGGEIEKADSKEKTALVQPGAALIPGSRSESEGEDSEGEEAGFDMVMFAHVYANDYTHEFINYYVLRLVSFPSLFYRLLEITMKMTFW